MIGLQNDKNAVSYRVLLIMLLVVPLISCSSAFAYLSPQKQPFLQTSISTTTLKAERRPWNLFRFVEQSSRFVNPITNARSTERSIERGDVLWKAGTRDNDFTFAPLDDVVMGGASASQFDAATGKWTGEVTDANNGGFVGIRSTPFVEYDMSKCQGIELQIASKDALRLKVVVRDSTDFNGIGWTSSVNIPAKKGATVKVPFAKQVPTRFAQTVSGQYFSKDQVRGLQLVFSKFEYDGELNPKFRLGDFQLQVDEIRAY